MMIAKELSRCLSPISVMICGNSNGGDNDLLAGLDHRPEIQRAFGVSHCGPDLGKLLDGVPNLTIQNFGGQSPQ